jgi:ABC-2 type transport system ATP-binding protein
MKMELCAALLHSPEVLFLDEPTIGLDVVAQHNIQRFLRYYQEERKTTILLTSHYMKDIAALCKRVVIMADGEIKYDDSLAGIVDRFSSHKIVTVLLNDGTQAEKLRDYGEVLSVEAPRVRLRIERERISATLSLILDRFLLDDVAVEDPPLEDVIADFFTQVSNKGSDDASDPFPTEVQA